MTIELPILLAVTYPIAAFGLAYIVGHSKISLPIRVWIDPVREVHTGVFKVGKFRRPREFVLMLLECPACFGFWTGLLTGLIAAPFVFVSLLWAVFAAIGLGLFTCGFNFLFGRLTGLVDY